MNKIEKSPGLATIRNLLMLIAAMLLVTVMGAVPVVRADDATIVDSGTFKSGGTWSLNSDGELTLSGDIACDESSPTSSSWPWYNYRQQIIKIVAEKDTTLSGSAAYMFYYQHALTNVGGLTNLGTSNVTNMSYMFYSCDSLTNLSGLANWNTSKVTNMSEMFYSCRSLTGQTHLAKWNTSNVTSMSEMFYSCTHLTDLSDLASWNTSNVTNMGGMFRYCYGLTSLSGLENWDTSKVTNMSEMFYSCTRLTDLTPIANWDTSKITNMGGMFGYCYGLTSLSGLENWNTSKVTNMSKMFRYCSSLTNLSPIANWKTSNVTNMSEMFYDCRSLTDQTPLANWDMSNMTNMSEMFYDCYRLMSFNASSWDIKNTASSYQMLLNCPVFDSVKLSDSGSIVMNGATATISGVFNSDRNTALWPELRSHIGIYAETLKVEKNVSLEGNTEGLFTSFVNLKSIDLSEFDTSKLESVKSLFAGCSSLNSGIFPGGGIWDLSSDGTLTLSGAINWPVKDAESWPWHANRANIKKVVIADDTVLTSSASYLFAGLSNTAVFEGLDKFDVSKAQTAGHMFENCASVSDLSGVSNWNVSGIKDMTSMFAWCTEAAKNMTSTELIKNWKIDSNTDTTDIFLGWETSNSIEIEKFEVDLYNKSDFEYDKALGTYSITPTSHRDWNADSSNKDKWVYLSPTYSVNFALSGKDSDAYSPGQIELRIPAAMFHDRYGNNEKAYTNFSIPQAPTISTKTPFNYTYDSTTNEYVINNTETVSAASEFSFTFPYSSPYPEFKVRDGSKSDDFYAKLTVNGKEVKSSVQKSAPGIYTYTSVQYNHKYYNNKPDEINDGSKKVIGNTLYVTYTVRARINTTQEYMERLSVSTSVAGATVSIKDCEYTQGKENSYWHVTVGYPLNGMDDGKKHKLDVSFLSNLYGEDGDTDTWSDTYSFNYEYSVFNPGYLYEIDKQAYGVPYNGSVDALQHNIPVDVWYYFSGTAKNYKLTADGNTSSPDNYGKNSWTFAITDNNVQMNKQLKSDDYEMKNFNITITPIKYAVGDNGWEESTGTDEIEYKIYANTDGGEWQYIQKGVTRTSSSVDLSGKNYTGFKVECESSLYGFTWSGGINVTIKPSKYVLSYITTVLKSSTSVPVKNKLNLEVTNYKGNNVYNGSDSATDYLAKMTELTSIKKTSKVTTCPAEQQFKVGYEIEFSDKYEYSTEALFNKLVVSGAVTPQNGGTFYDLLPLGTVVDENTIRTDDAKDLLTVETQENYNGTGRTLLTVHVKSDDSITYNTSFILYYTVYYPFECIHDFGQTIKNDVIYKTDNQSWTASGVGTAKDWVTSLDGKSEKKFISTTCTDTVSIGSAAVLSLSKSVRDSGNTSYSQGHDGEVVVSQNEEYSYKLRFGSIADTKTSDIILFDSIENYVTDDGKKSGWKGTLESIDLTQPKLKGIAPVVYYSTVESLDLSVDENHDITNSKVWTKMTDDTDLTKVTAVAIDMRKTASGKNYILPEKSTIRVVLNMKAPEGKDNYLVPAKAGLRAYNNVYLSDTITTTTGYSEDQYIHYDYTEVCLENTAPDAIQIKLSALKNLADAGNSGRSLAADEFSFNLKDSSGNVLDTVKNDKDGNIVFKEIEFEEEGTYTYTIEEVLPTGGTYSEDKKKYVKDNITYDLNPITVSIVVTVNDNNELVATKQ